MVVSFSLCRHHCPNSAALCLQRGRALSGKVPLLHFAAASERKCSTRSVFASPASAAEILTL